MDKKSPDRDDLLRARPPERLGAVKEKAPETVSGDGEKLRFGAGGKGSFRQSPGRTEEVTEKRSSARKRLRKYAEKQRSASAKEAPSRGPEEPGLSNAERTHRHQKREALQNFSPDLAK